MSKNVIIDKDVCSECGKEITIGKDGGIGQVDELCTTCYKHFCREHLSYYNNYLTCKKCIEEHESKKEMTNMSEDAIKISKEDISNEEIEEVLEDVTLMVMRKSSDKKNFHILKMLPSRISDIAEKLEMSENVANRRIKGLISSGLVSEEAESSLVNITELGKQMLNLIDYIKGRTKDEVMKIIDEGGLERK